MSKLPSETTVCCPTNYCTLSYKKAEYCHSTLTGNIRVLGRVRPPIKEDGSGDLTRQVVSCDQEDDCLVNVVHKGRTQKFELDRVFHPSVSQQEVLYNNLVEIKKEIIFVSDCRPGVPFYVWFKFVLKLRFDR